jgi:hypothetical protein
MGIPCQVTLPHPGCDWVLMMIFSRHPAVECEPHPAVARFCGRPTPGALRPRKQPVCAVAMACEHTLTLRRQGKLTS